MATAASVEWPAFRVGHATHPDAHMALALAAAQVEAQAQAQTQPWTGTGVATPNLGWLYITDRYVDAASTLLRELRLRWPGVAWTGCVGIGVAASGVEYFDEPALVLMLAALPQGSFRLFNGQHPLPRGLAHTALVHADGAEADLQTLVGELAERTDSGYLFGGLTASRGRNLQFSLPVQVALDPEGEAAGLYEGGVSGVAFDAGLPLLSRVTQGCQPVGPVRQVTAAQNNLVLGLDGEPALPALLADLGVTLDDPKQALPRLRATLAGLTDSRDDMLQRAGQFGADTRVRHLIGLDPLRSGVALADRVEAGMQLAFCTRNTEAARRDLVRICAELREELCPEEGDGIASGGTGAVLRPEDRVAGAIYVSCSGRGGPHFGAPSAELQLIRHALGDVPLVGFFAGGEIARRHVYGYTGVLTLFLKRASGQG
jgi:small ligand-binding sensory domain FIST